MLSCFLRDSHMAETWEPALEVGGVDEPFRHSDLSCSNSGASRIAVLRLALDKATAERDDLREATRISSRNFEQFQAFITLRIDAKEKELRYLLAPRPVVSESDGIPVSQSPNPTTPVKPSVLSVRPVPTLIGGSTKCTDSLLGPAHGPVFSSSASANPPSFNRPELRKSICEPVNSATELDDSVLYSKVPIDTSVSLVLSRLRRTQNSCNALVTSNQTDLQSFTFTQNSQNGKRIMMRVRVLEQENEELANANRTGRAAKLETEIALRRRFVQDLKQTYSDIEYLVEEVESETELFGSSLLMLQQRLSMAKITAQLFATELEALEPGRARALFEGATWSPFNSTTAESAQPADSLLQNVMAVDDSREVHRFEPTVPLPKVTSSSDFPPGPPDKGPAQPSHTSHGDNKKNHRSRTKHSTKRSKTSSHDKIETTPLGSQPDDREIITNKCRRTGESRCLPQRPANQIPITRPPIPVKGPQRTFDESRDTRDRCDRTPFDPHFPARRDVDTPIAASNSHPDKSPTNCYPLSDNSTTNDRASNGQLADDISAAQ